jgi:hypothetical protein
VEKTREAALEREVDSLYQLPLSQFTSARDELAKRLRADGERKAADQVKQLRKPTAAVWLVNRLARERELDVQRLAKAGAELSKSQKSAAGGSKASDAFVEARREEQRALERLAQAARETATREGIGAAAVDRATQTLRAASLTEEGRELLKRGRLTGELDPPGFEAFTKVAGDAPVRSVRRQNAQQKDDAATNRRVLKAATDRVRELRREERELDKAARAAEQDADRAEKQASESRSRADEAQTKATAASSARAKAEADLDQLG